MGFIWVCPSCPVWGTVIPSLPSMPALPHWTPRRPPLQGAGWASVSRTACGPGPGLQQAQRSLWFCRARNVTPPPRLCPICHCPPKYSVLPYASFSQLLVFFAISIVCFFPECHGVGIIQHRVFRLASFSYFQPFPASRGPASLAHGPFLRPHSPQRSLFQL